MLMIKMPLYIVILLYLFRCGKTDKLFRWHRIIIRLFGSCYDILSDISPEDFYFENTVTLSFLIQDCFVFFLVAYGRLLCAGFVCVC